MTARGCQAPGGAARQVGAGARAVLVYVVQRTDCAAFASPPTSTRSMPRASPRRSRAGSRPCAARARSTWKGSSWPCPCRSLLAGSERREMSCRNWSGPSELGSPGAQVPLHDAAALRRHAPRRPARGERARHDHRARPARRDHGRARPAVPRLHPRSWRGAGAAPLPRLSEVDLHLDQPRGLPRHSRASAGCWKATSSTSTSR